MIDEYEDSIRGMITDLEQAITVFEACKPSEKQDHITSITGRIKSIKEELDLFNSEIHTLDYGERKEFEVTHNVLENDLKRIENDFTMKKMAGSHLEDELKNIGNMSQADLQKKALAHGDKLLKARKDRAQNILFTINQANMLVDDINDEIKEQNQRMMDMEEIIKDSQSALKRANELVGFFAKAFYRDLILKLLIVLIAIAIIAVVIASVAKKRAIKKSEDPNINNGTVPKPPAPTPTRLLASQDIWSNIKVWIPDYDPSKESNHVVTAQRID